MNINSVIFESQFGFQKGRSTVHSLIEIVENIRSCMDNSMYGCGIFIDLKKAFDTVNHEILIKKIGTLWGERKKFGVVCFVSKW